ncbi:hypothetical protein [Streptomyces sp. NPDC018711]|uniref:hypothetical protein n=1 Tax=Streptomyces sp. NPDC018711 TaxID=3365052 RepID=UPI0037B4E129
MGGRFREPALWGDAFTLLGHGAVKTYIGRLPHRLRARDRAQPVIGAYESGLVSAGRDGGGG